MKITHIGHASTLIEAGGLRILTDPWWCGPCFGAQWWIYPRPFLEAVQDQRLDYIYISHGHEDHFHPGTLRTLDKNARLLVSRGSSFLPQARSLGFNVVEIAPDTPAELGPGLFCRIVPTYGGDTFMTLTDGRETLVNLNDAVHALPRYLARRFAQLIRRYHPAIDYVFCGHGVASHYPNCYVVPGKDRTATAQKRQMFFNRSWSHVAASLSPRFAFPFAADVILLENDLMWANEPVHNTRRPTEVFQDLYPGSPTRVLDIAPGFCVEGGAIREMRLREPLRMSSVQDEYREQIARANRYAPARPEHVEQVRRLLAEGIERRRRHFSGFPRDYRFLVRMRNTQAGILVVKRGESFSVDAIEDVAKAGKCDLAYTARLPYLQRSLTTPFGCDLLFIGSGGIFEYPDRSRLGESLHEELMAMLSPFARTPPRILRRAKTWIKNALGRDELDL
ncbi:MAG TPA: MBL fold metallo-hydrolase, partial [Burkholderiales bacterium]|nr:MBL fold metallo-hydrolase [Burkholderiales bacterium]